MLSLSRADLSICGAKCKNLARGPSVALLWRHHVQSTVLRLF